MYCHYSFANLEYCTEGLERLAPGDRTLIENSLLATGTRVRRTSSYIKPESEGERSSIHRNILLAFGSRHHALSPFSDAAKAASHSTTFSQMRNK
mmetsp:Transcript_10342/g.23206  ORF Transcript_10342/g.23206 Transcript_10342/m.23206 type:complete len:95 (-) Transcript_10342:1148-1432(-)